jgi:hypothetical protein
MISFVVETIMGKTRKGGYLAPLEKSTDQAFVKRRRRFLRQLRDGFGA